MAFFFIERHLIRALLTLLVGGLCNPILSQAQSAYKFKINTPVETPQVDTKSAPTQEQEVEASVAVKQLKTVLGFPRARVNAAYSPGYLGGKQTLTTGGEETTFNLAGAVFTDFSAKVNVEISPRVNFDLAIHYFPISTGGDDSDDTYVIGSSSTSLIPITFTGAYCFFYEGWAGKICPGLSLGVESFPVYSFVSGSQLDLTKISDMTLGARVSSENPLLGNLILNSVVAFEYGLKTGQASNIELSKDMKFWGAAELELELDPDYSLTAGFILEDRIANFTKGIDTWETTSLNYAARLGFTYNFGSRKRF